MPSVKKRRTTVWLPVDLLERLKKLSSKTGAPMAELFRRAVVAYLKRKSRAGAVNTDATLTCKGGMSSHASYG